ncbi:ribosome silencing factor [Testudinibacter sp. TR-2022]|nr:ribosome silencing factor [Pasteurellaceae bacterium Phil31]TNH10902.1 ribosome silencing factor [Testudinibacter sp. TR-2022]TNH11072.1 ribosome silencing factor [Testudinibacter sp. TR-2022]TNH12352.1 ribosome silencing factor [Testudinibacter sp. TR-2022]TNH19112.1 ribosome silencing factor [Testudinibacter sp. TR-2022]
MRKLLQNSLVKAVTEILDDLKATDISIFDVRANDGITDNMVICTGTSSRHVGSIAQNLAESCKQQGIESFGSEGVVTADWIVVDFGQVIVHVMQQESRDLYQLEKLWG